MIETAKLRGRIVEIYGTLDAFSSAVHNSKSFISQYLNGKRKLNQESIFEWAAALEISISDIPLYFFTRKVH